MVHQGIERWDGAQAQLDWEALSPTKISAVPMLSSVGARSFHPNLALIPVDALPISPPHHGLPHSFASHPSRCRFAVRSTTTDDPARQTTTPEE
jgi:hypothetical protein